MPCPRVEGGEARLRKTVDLAEAAGDIELPAEPRDRPDPAALDVRRV
jgi:hypothetical protein